MSRKPREKIVVGFGPRVKMAREKLRMSREELAAQIGVCSSVLGRLERDELGVYIDRLVKISTVLGRTPNWLLGLGR